jgi:type IV secretory pathway VirB9-like protein
MFPYTWHTSAVPALPAKDEGDNKAEWVIGYVQSGIEDTYRESWVIRPVYSGLDATTPVLFKGGQFFVLHLTSQEKQGTLAVAWEGEGTVTAAAAKPVKAAPTGPRPPKIALDRLHIQYKIEAGKSPVAWMPAECYDDGNLTVVRFPESLKFTSAPVLSALEGKRTLPIEYTVFAVPDHPEKGEFYVTRGLHPRLQLRDGKGGIVTITRLPTPEPVYAEKKP